MEGCYDSIDNRTFVNLALFYVMNLQFANKFIHPDMVIDVGANRGYWFKEAKEVWPDAYYFLIEGDDDCSAFLEACNVDFTIAVLSDKPKTVTFYKLKDNPCATGNSYYREQTQFYEGDNAVPHKVHTKTLDEVCSHLDFGDKKVLLKIDTQGSEMDILKGAKVVLKSCTALIVEVSYTEYNKGAPTFSIVDEYLKAQDFANYGAIGDSVHPISRELIQQDMLYLR